MKITIDKNEVVLSFSEMKARRTWIRNQSQQVTASLAIHYVGESICVKMKDLEQYIPICWYYASHIALDAKGLRSIVKLQERVNKRYKDYLFESNVLTSEASDERSKT